MSSFRLQGKHAGTELINGNSPPILGSGLEGSHPSQEKKKQIPNIGYFRVFKEYPQKSQIWQSETSPNQVIPNQSLIYLHYFNCRKMFQERKQ